MNQPANESIQQHDKYLAERRQRAPPSLVHGPFFFHHRTRLAKEEQQGNGTETNCGVELRVPQSLDRVYQDPVWRLSRIDAGNSQHDGQLSGHDGNCCGGDEGRDGDVRNELNKPSQSEQAEEEKQRSRDGREGLRDVLGRVYTWLGFGDFGNDSSDQQRSNGRRL